jgi:hypothetical protein
MDVNFLEEEVMKKRLLTTLVALTGLFLLSASIVMAAPAPVPVPVAQTGQTTSYRTGDDGDLQKGVVSPSPRFIDNGDGTVTDNLTGLMWAKDANLAKSTMTWNAAIDYANNKVSLGTSCGGEYTDWRLPNRNELNSLIDVSNFVPALPSGHPFFNVQSSNYWSSTTLAYYNDSYAWDVHMIYGYVSSTSKTYDYYVWPVRGGN